MSCVRAASAGLVVGMLLAACGGARQADATTDEIARRVGPRIVESLAGDTDAEELHAALVRALRELEPPAGVEAVAAGRSWQMDPAEPDGLDASFSVVIRPAEGEAYCALLAVARNGETASVRAQGDTEEACVEAEPVGPSSHLFDGWRRHPG